MSACSANKSRSGRGQWSIDMPIADFRFFQKSTISQSSNQDNPDREANF
jgi:hypothetical protein